MLFRSFAKFTQENKLAKLWWVLRSYSEFYSFSKVVKSKKVFGFVHETVQVLQKINPELALRLFLTVIALFYLSFNTTWCSLQAAQSADDCSYEAISYEFVVKVRSLVIIILKICYSFLKCCVLSELQYLFKAFEVFEEEFSDSKAQFNAINYMVWINVFVTFTCGHLGCLYSKSAQYGARELWYYS